MRRERFDQYMERCLYDAGSGFYTAGLGSAGRRRGDFITSPEVGPLFADVISSALDAWWEDLGGPDPFAVYDVGSGPGTLARLLAKAPGPSSHARRVIGVDVAGERDGVTGSATPSPANDGFGFEGTVVIANELLDNLPFRIVERHDAGWFEVFVVGDDHGGVNEELSPVDEEELGRRFRDLHLDLPVGTRVPVQSEAGLWVDAMLERGASRVVIFDYGAATTAELATRGGWLRTYREHERGDDPYREPGRWDITADVAIDQLPAPTEIVDQATFLRRWGIDELVEEGRRHWQANAAAPDLHAFRMRSRIREAEALLDPSGLGSWLVCSWM